MPKNIQLFNKLILVTILSLLVLAFLQSANSPDDELSTSDTHADSLPLPALPDDTVSVYRYRAWMDSIRRKEAWEKAQVNDKGESFYAFFIGYRKILDTASGNKEGYYFALPHYRLKPSFEFSIQGGNYYLKPAASDKKAPNDSSLKQIHVRYLPDEPSQPDVAASEKSGVILLPISFKTFRYLRIATYVLLLLVFAWLIYAIIVLPWRVLVSIAKGQPFTKQTVRYLFITGWTLIGLIICSLLSTFICQVAFSKWIPDEFYISYTHAILNSNTELIPGLIVLLLGAAFRTGLEIREDTDLTI